MATFILIAGGWQGGWVYQKVADILVGHGHKVLPITLSGLGDAPAPSANLETHVSEVVDVVKSHSDDLILVGQSYGGMIVSGVADAVPSRIRSLVYVDAYVPETGDSVWSLTTPRFRDMFIAGAKGDGLNCAPPSNLDPRCRPQPIATFLQSITLTERWRDTPRKVFVGAHGWDGSPFLDLFQRLSHETEWSTYSLDCGHNVAKLEPDALAQILLTQTYQPDNHFSRRLSISAITATRIRRPASVGGFSQQPSLHLKSGNRSPPDVLDYPSMGTTRGSPLPKKAYPKSQISEPHVLS